MLSRRQTNQQEEFLGKPYSDELDIFASTYQWAGSQDVDNLRHFLNRWSGEYVAVVGSGGSFSAALVVALFRELVHHSPSVAVTPLEFDALSRRLAPRALLLSAEGKNRDILAAAQSAQSADLACAALTLTSSNPLIDFARTHATLRPFAFQMDWIKDGYLATNSLLAFVLLVYRTLFGESDFIGSLSSLFAPERLKNRRAYFQSWNGLVQMRKKGVLVLFSAQAKPFAIDLESKLAEASLTRVQFADLRQCAHGRHLQLASTEAAPSVLVVSSSEEGQLAHTTAALLPSYVQHWVIDLDGHREQDVAVAGLLDAMFLTEAIANNAGVDPGQPFVPSFGRAIHAVDSAAILHRSRKEQPRLELASRRKLAPNTPPSLPINDDVLTAAAAFDCTALRNAHA